MHLEKSLRQLFNYIDPCEENKKVFSIELYSILLRACTEVESNCKDILVENNYKMPSHPNMNDYKKIENSSKLSKYTLEYSPWKTNNSDKLSLKPFASWDKNIQLDDELGHNWYSNYNTVKHNREKEFKLANLINCFNAVGANLILLHSQFGYSCLDPYNVNRYQIEIEGEDDFELPYMDTIFKIIPPDKQCWSDNEKYNFDWEAIKNDSQPFQHFSF